MALPYPPTVGSRDRLGTGVKGQGIIGNLLGPYILPPYPPSIPIKNGGYGGIGGEGGGKG